MHFLTILKSGVSVESVAKDFVRELLQKSWDANELSLEFASDFVHAILTAIGLKFHIIPEQIVAGGTMIWPMEQIQIFSFHFNEMEFKKLEQFLLLVCCLIQQQNDKFLDELKEDTTPEEDLETPVEYLMQLIAIWCNVYKQLQQLEELQTLKRFEEPLARINYHLLLGMHDVRKMYRLDLHILDAICNRLYWSAVQGLFYKQSHDMIFNGLLNIFSKDYNIFYENSSQSINFFYEAFSVELNSLTPLKIYQEFQKMLNDNIALPDADEDEDNTAVLQQSNKINILINFLIEPYMLQVYYSTILAKRGKSMGKIKGKNLAKLQQEALKFLYVLQGKLLTLDCFSREFLEAILYLILKNEPHLGDLASNLYITMMKRKFSEQIILKHIMDFYAAHLDSMVYLKPCVLNMCNSFGFLLNFDNFLEIISDANSSEIIRLLSAHVLVIIFEVKLNKNVPTTHLELEHLLQLLPELFENLQCQKTIGILMEVFSLITVQKLQKSTIDNFIHYAVGVFTQIDISLEYPLLMNIFAIFHECLVSTREWHHLELLSDHLNAVYQEMIKELQQIADTQNELLFKTSLVPYNDLVKRLNIIFKVKYDVLDINLWQTLKQLFKYFLNNETIQNVITSERSLIDIYALEIIISIILKLTKARESDSNPNYSFSAEIQELLTYLWLRLENMETLLKMPMVRLKTYFSCLIHLFTHLPLKLENKVYHQIVQVLINVNLKSQPLNRKLGDELQQLHPMQSLEYQRLMFRQFIEMHKKQHVDINTNVVWKLCIYYGMSKCNFNEELKNLLVTLASYRLKIYKNIIAVLIYNLYNQKPALKYSTVTSILKQHKQLIDNEIPLESSNLLKVHIVLLVLQIVEKALTVQRLKVGTNRLEALKHLNTFIEDLDLSLLQAKQLMEDQLNNYQKHLLTADERKYIEDFKQVI